MRDDRVSVMKGLAIIGVVAGHCAFSPELENWVNQWCLATFFFVAGYCFNDKYVVEPWGYAKRRIKTLYLPFVEIGLFFLVLHNLLAYWGIVDGMYSWDSAIEEVFCLTVRLTSHEPLMGAMWFCPILLLGVLVMLMIIKISQVLGDNLIAVVKRPDNYKIIRLLAFLLCFVTGAIASWQDYKSPYCIFQVMEIVWIIGCGYFFKQVVVRYNGMVGWMTQKPCLLLLFGCLGWMLLSQTMDSSWIVRLQPANVRREFALALFLLPAVGAISVWCCERFEKLQMDNLCRRAFFCNNGIAFSCIQDCELDNMCCRQ